MGVYELLNEAVDSRKGGNDCDFNGYLETYMAKPETQESIRKAKITTVRLAERGLSALKTFLKVEEEPKE